MSNTETFIDEVTEEVRREKLFGLMKRWGWVAVLAVLVLVGGAAFSEWRKAQDRAQAEALGDAIVAALSIEDASARAEALAALPSETPEQAVLAAMLSAGSRAVEGDAGAAQAFLDIADTAGIEPLYRHLALLKGVMAGGTGDAAQDAAILEEVATPGAPFRALAMEQQALALVDAGDADGAITLLRSLSEEAGVTDGLRRRALQLIVALGGSADPA